MDGHRFDTLTKVLASYASRRNVIRGIGGFVAAAFGLIGHQTGFASNRDCAHFCNAVFPPGSARGRCKSEAAKHVPGNLCEACDVDPGRVVTGLDGAKTCCDPSLVCVAPSGATTCCASDDICTASGECVPPSPVCTLITTAPCDLDDDQCCGTVTGNPLESFCKNVEDLYPGLVSRCCIPPDTGIPCSGQGGNHCAPDGPCTMCCTDRCGPQDDAGNAYCVRPGDS
jgi:hypothetical protein